MEVMTHVEKLLPPRPFESERPLRGAEQQPEIDTGAAQPPSESPLDRHGAGPLPGAMTAGDGARAREQCGDCEGFGYHLDRDPNDPAARRLTCSTCAGRGVVVAECEMCREPAELDGLCARHFDLVDAQNLVTLSR